MSVSFIPGVIVALAVIYQPEPAEAVPLTPRVDAPAEAFDPAQRMFDQANELAMEGRYYDASLHIVRAYRILDEARMFDDTGLFMLKKAVLFHLRAYRETNDEQLLASIQPPLETFLEHYEGRNTDLHLLERKLEFIRTKRLAVADSYFERKRFVDAAEEASDCYRSLQTTTKGGPVGEQAAFQVSLSRRSAWYTDNQSRHFAAALEIVEDHIGAAGSSASKRILQERRLLLRGTKLVAVRGFGDYEADGPGEGLSGQERSYAIASGSSVAGGVMLGIGGAAFGGSSTERTPPPDEQLVVRAQLLVPGAVLSLAGAAVTGLAIHSMVDTGAIGPRPRRVIAFSGTALGVAALALGTALVISGQRGRGSRDDMLRHNAGLGLTFGTGVPLAAGVAALVSRRGAGPLGGVR